MVAGAGRLLFITWGTVLITLGCARGQKSISETVGVFQSTRIGYLSFDEAGQQTYPYAFSGQILDENTKEPVSKFSVELVGDDPAITTVLNQLGDERGLFHISRTPATETLQFSTAPLIISAVGYEPFVQMVDLGSDCLSANCPGVRPTPFFLKPVAGQTPAQKSLSIRKIQEIITQKGVSGLFRELISLGKWDSKTRNDLSQARNAELYPQVVVFLKAPSEDVTADLAAILHDADEKRLSKVPAQWTGRSQEMVEVAREHREVATSLLSVGDLLPYLNVIAPKLSAQAGGPLAGLVQRFLSEKNYESQLAAMMVSPKSENKPELAMVSLMPLLQGWISKGASSANYEGFLNHALSDRTTLEWLTQESFQASNDDVSLFAKYLQPLALGFVSKQGVLLMKEFNDIVGSEGLKNLRAFETIKNQHETIAP